MWLSACIGGIFLPLRMTVYIRFKPSHLPGSLETNGRRDHVDYYRTQDQLFRRLGVIIAACMYPGTIAGLPAAARLPLEKGGFGHTTRSCHHADEVPAAW